MMAGFTNPELRTATKTHDDAEKTLESVSVNCWSTDEHSRLYINDLFTGTTDVYVDLDAETLTVSGTKTRSTDIQTDGDRLTLTIERPSWDYKLVIDEAETREMEREQDEEDDEESDVDLERFGVDI